MCKTRKCVMAILHWKQGLLCDTTKSWMILKLIQKGKRKPQFNRKQQVKDAIPERIAGQSVQVSNVISNNFFLFCTALFPTTYLKAENYSFLKKLLGK